MNAAPEMELRNIDKSYGDSQLLRSFNLAIYSREFVTAIGSSGCGKTTILKLMNGLVRPDAGQVLFKGDDIAALEQNRLRRRIGYVIQGAGLFPHLRVEDNINYVPRLDGAKRRDLRGRVLGLLEILGLERDILRRYPRELSARGRAAILSPG